MDTTLVLSLHQHASVFRHGRIGRLARRPVKIARSAAIKRRCLKRGTDEIVRADTFWGGSMSVALPELVSLTIYRFGYLEDELSEIFLRTLKPGMTFFDVGSHIGYFSLLALHLVGDAGRVVAFEPTPSTRRVLDLNLSGHPNARVVPMAAYKESTTLTFRDFGPSHSAFNSLYSGKIGDGREHEAKTIRVPTTTLDGFAEASGLRPDFIKIDTEGAEPDVLAGARGLLSGAMGKRPMLSLEVGDAGGDDIKPSRAVVDLVMSAGYRPYELRGGEIVPHTPLERYEYSNLLFKPEGA